MSWRKYIKTVGIRLICSEVGLSYEQVRKWAAGICFPRYTVMDKLIVTMKKHLSISDFEDFCNSLVNDLVGINLNISGVPCPDSAEKEITLINNG